MEVDYDAERGEVMTESKNHCPFGCMRSDLDEHGYCPHLVGFTNDPRVGGVVETRQTNEKTGKTFISARHPDKVLASDKLINPQSNYVDQGVARTKKEWVSTRVYRKVKVPEVEPEIQPDPIPARTPKAKKPLTEEQKQNRRENLAKARAAKKKKLEPAM